MNYEKLINIIDKFYHELLKLYFKLLWRILKIDSLITNLLNIQKKCNYIKRFY